MKKFTPKITILAVFFSLTFLPQFISYAGNFFQQPEPAWVVWETSTPVQRVAWDGSALWAGQYKGGLTQWTLETGQSANYTTANGLTGNHVVSIAVDGGGQKWLALQDGSLNLTTDGASFNDLTPYGIAGENAWDVSLNGNEAWLATLGGGVSHYTNNGWTTYNSENSDLPYDDIYTVAANGGSPWVGTIGYGVANLQGDTWIHYALPTQIENPLQAGQFKPNQAVTDIVVDGAGNKWFATDGSGVAVLDSSNTNWTIYDTSNSGISSNFIQSIYLDSQGNHWFGTLGGGVSRLAANLTDWQTYNTTNSPLPEDDVLGISVDNAGGLWLAAYDSGLAYYGTLPSPAPEFELDLAGQAEYTPGQVKGYYLWVDPETFEWTLAWSADGRAHTYEGEITSDSTFTILEQTGMESGDSASTDGNNLTISANEQSGQDRVTFKPDPAATVLTVRLKIDGAHYPYNIHIGSSASTPGTSPFRIAALQPQAPVVNAGKNNGITIPEGDTIVLSGDVSDPDSPLEHTYLWDFNDDAPDVNTLTTDRVYKDEGIYTAQLTVTDIHGLSATDSVTITIENVAPTADFYFDPFEPDAGEPIAFTGSFYDPGELDTHAVSWDFGDGSAPITGQSLEAVHTYLSAGTFQVAFTVTDNDGGTSTANTTILIAEAPTPTPTATPTETATPTPTNTPEPTSTPTSTPTVTATATNASSIAMVVLLDSEGNGLAGATFQYYSGSWRNIPGATDANGKLSYSGLGLGGNVTFRITYANATIQKQQNISTNPQVVFQTKPVALQLLGSNGLTQLNGDAEYYSNGWRTFGNGATNTTMELLPLSYTFRVTYGGASLQMQQNIGNNSTVVFQTKLLSMKLLASDGSTVLTGNAEYYANGWKSFGDGSTTTTMELLPVNYTFRVSYGGASIQKQQDVSVDPAVAFQTQLTSIKLLASDGVTELTGDSEYYANGWKTFGNGTTTTTMELLPVNYTFRVSYGGTSIQKQQDVSVDSAVSFQTKLTSMKLLASDGVTELTGGAEYYANGWRTFGNGSTSTTMELLPVNYTFRVSYGGASIQKQQDVSIDPAVTFQTQLTSMKLLASDGVTELTGDSEYYANGWKTFGNGTTTTTMELLPVNYTFRVSYGGASIQKQQDISADSVVVFQTVLTTMKLLASDGITELIGSAEYYASGWKTFGNNTTTTMELLPAEYTFRISYSSASIQKQQDVSSDTVVVFKTTQVHSESNSATQYYASGWKTFTQDMELLPGSYAFKFGDGTPQATYILVAESINNIH